ncbi:hypothetical protein E6H27_01025 [Candidatus Bathyarchaeota archaeon]|nr:MAG: hypothetical protein E6H27_01025 [Candidatus Bathyarchaeota archaeon]
MASQAPLLTLAKFLVLIGGIVLLIGGILQAIDVRVLMDFGTNLARLGSFTGIVVGILVGILALVGSREVANPCMEPHPPNTRLIRWKPRLHTGLHRGPNRPRRPLRENLMNRWIRSEVIILRD